MNGLRPLALHMPDADHLTPEEIWAALELKPAAMLCLVYAMWDGDKGVSDQIADLVAALGHDRLYVRFHADPHPPGYAGKIGGPEAWGRLCAQRIEQYYGPLARAGVQLHAILANEVDAGYEGGLNVNQASNFYRRCLTEYAAKRPQDILHVPAPTGAPSTHRAYLEQYERDGWVRSDYWIDGHGYDGDLENVLNVLQDVYPGHQYSITETNDLADFGWPVELLRQRRVRDIIYFTLNWARGGEGRVQPPSPDDRAKQMSLLRFPDRYRQFMALPLVGTRVPDPDPPKPEEPTMPPDPWRYWTAQEMAAATGCPVAAVREHWPRLNEQLWHCGLDDRPVHLAMIATVALETASRFEPIHEFRNADGSIPSWWFTYDGGPEFHGRGYIQITHRSNYALYGPKVAELWGTSPDQPDFNLVGEPDRALDPDISAAVAALYFRDHRRDDGYGIPDAARDGDWREVRRLVQGGSAGLDRLVQIVAALGGTVPAGEERTYGPNVPDDVVLQRNAWSCAVRATYAALWAMQQQGQGQGVSYGDEGPADVYEWLVPTYDAPGVGLLDHTGAGLVEALRARGYPARNVYPVSIDQVRDVAGRVPVLLGGDGWNHWACVRGKTADNGLILENPSPGHMGISDYLRDSFGRLGPMAMVVIDGPQVTAPAVDYASLTGLAYNEDGVVVPALAAALANPDDANLRVQVDAVIRWIRANRPAA